MEAVMGARPARGDLAAPRLFDVLIVFVAVALVSFSIVMVYSTTGVIASEKFGDPLHYLKRQVAAAVAGLFLMYIFSRIKIDLVRRFSPFALPIVIGLLVMTLIPGLGDRAGGAQRWVNLPFIRFQPAEFVKVLFIIYIAGFIARHESRLASFSQGVVKPFLLVCLVAGLLLMQPDFGSTVVIALITFCMIGVSGVRLRYIFLSFGVAAMCLATLIAISPYRMKRIVSFLSPFADASGKGYQLIQSLIAVGSGKVTGVGLGASQQKLFYLPAAHTDFIYSVIAEELGFIGCLIVLTLFLLFLWRGLKLAGELADDSFSFALAVGLTLLIALPALLNIGVVTGMLPTKGMVLPLVGYGGSSLVTCLAAIGILLSLSRNARRQ